MAFDVDLRSPGAFANIVLTSGGLTAELSESLTVSEAITAVLTPLGVTVSENATVTESVTAEVTPLEVLVAESVSITEATATSSEASLVVDQSESLTITEAITAELNPLTAVLAETVTVTEAVIQVLNLGRVVSETITITEGHPISAVLAETTLSVFKAETVSVVEQVTRQATSNILTATPGEGINVEESVALAFVPVVWDGSGSPPAPISVAGDYWSIGV